MRYGGRGSFEGKLFGFFFGAELFAFFRGGARLAAFGGGVGGKFRWEVIRLFSKGSYSLFCSGGSSRGRFSGGVAVRGEVSGELIRLFSGGSFSPLFRGEACQSWGWQRACPEPHALALV